jgi:hypothetical protein
MHVHLARAKRDQKKLEASGDFTRIAESGTTKCYFHQVWRFVTILETYTQILLYSHGPC